jgi:uncharacterized protein (TIGR02246 family)
MSQRDDLEEVRELYNRYALSWDDNHAEELAGCFTPDGVFESYRGRFAGRDAIVGNLADFNLSLGAGRKQRHITTNVSIQLEGDRAKGTAYFIFYVGCDGKIERTAFGHYRDELRKVDGRWFFTSREGIAEGQTIHSP